jgi:hypothetical protein
MTLILDLVTVENAPRFFALLSLMLRASGFTVVVMDSDPKRNDGEKVAALAGVPLQEFHHWSGVGDVQTWKAALAKAYEGKVVWVDEELGRWRGPAPEREGLVVCNWRAVLAQGGVTVPAVQA